MARRVEKRKAPPRELQPLKERLKIAGYVFDDKTIEALIHLINTGAITSLDFPIASGKESFVFRATRRDPGTGRVEHRAVKIFKFETTAFRHMAPYITGDPRFARVRRKRRPLVLQWARKEFANLKICEAAKVEAPRPLALEQNVIVMSFIGSQGSPAPLLKDAALLKPECERVLEKILSAVRALWHANLVHADLSEYNIMLRDGQPVLFDMAQAVSRQHPGAEEFLTRDVANILRYFSKLGIERNLEKTLRWIKTSG